MTNLVFHSCCCSEVLTQIDFSHPNSCQFLTPVAFYSHCFIIVLNTLQISSCNICLCIDLWSWFPVLGYDINNMIPQLNRNGQIEKIDSHRSAWKDSTVMTSWAKVRLRNCVQISVKKGSYNPVIFSIM